MENFATVAKKEMTEFIYTTFSSRLGFREIKSHGKYGGPIRKRALIKNNKNNNDHNIDYDCDDSYNSSDNLPQPPIMEKQSCSFINRSRLMEGSFK